MSYKSHSLSNIVVKQLYFVIQKVIFGHYKNIFDQNISDKKNNTENKIEHFSPNEGEKVIQERCVVRATIEEKWVKESQKGFNVINVNSYDELKSTIKNIQKN